MKGQPSCEASEVALEELSTFSRQTEV